MVDAKERREREAYARDSLAKAIKEHEAKKGVERSGESIQREVNQIAENVERKKSNPIYR